jgi:hypothetical protein
LAKYPAISRSKPTVVVRHTDPRSYLSTGVLAGTAVYALSYKGKLVAARKLNTLVSYPGPKYVKCSAVNPGHIAARPARNGVGPESDGEADAVRP